MKGFALGLALKQKQKATQKSPFKQEFRRRWSEVAGANNAKHRAWFR